MRFMMIVQIPTALGPEAWKPDPESVGAMTRYNEELLKAGVMLSGDGLLPPREGARVGFTDDGVTVTDGPFTEAKEVIGGFWIIDVKSKEEAVQWARRCPMDEGDVLELRRVAEADDFPDDVQEAAKMTEEPPEQTASRD